LELPHLGNSSRGTVGFAAISMCAIDLTFSKERAIAVKHKLSAKKIEEKKDKRQANQKRGKLEKRQDRRDSKHD